MRCRTSGLLLLPLFRIEIDRQAAQLGERVIDIAVAIVGHQRFVAGQRRGNADFLRSPVEIDADRVRAETP